MKENVNSTLYEIRTTFCKEKSDLGMVNNGVSVNIWNNNTHLDKILSKMPMLSNDASLKITMFPPNVIRNIARAYNKYNSVVDYSFQFEKKSDNAEGIYPSTLSIAFKNKAGKIINLQFSNNVMDAKLDLNIPLSINYKNCKVFGDISNKEVFDKTVESLLDGSNPTVGYYQFGGPSSMAERVTLSEIDYFTLPTNEKISRVEMAEYLAINKDAFINAIEAKVFVQGLVNQSDEQAFYAINQITNLYQIGCIENNELLKDAMKYAMTTLSLGYYDSRYEFKLPSTKEIANGIIVNGIDGPYKLKEYGDINNDSPINTYRIDMDTYDIVPESDFSKNEEEFEISS